MEGTEPMAVDDASPQNAEEHPDVSNVSNRKFHENMQYCTTTLKTQDVETILKPINGVLNSGGGIVEMKIDGFSKLKPEDLNDRVNTFWSALQPKLNLMVQPSAYADVFHKKLEKDTIRLFISATEHFCTVDYNLYLPGDAGLLLPSNQKVVDLLSERDSLKEKTDSPQVPLTDLISLVPEQFKYKEVLNFHESKQIQFKYYTSKNELFHNNNRKAQDEIAKHFSSFGNGIGGVIFIGIKDNGEVHGQSKETGSKKNLESGFNEMIKEMSKTWSFTPTQGVHWDVQFFPVTEAKESRSVIAILIAGMQNLGGIFTKCPKSFELQNASGSGGREKIVPLDFNHWEERMLSSTCKGESKGVKEVWKKFEMMTISKGPLLTLQGSVEEIQKDFFPVEPGCPISPKGFEANLPETAQQVIRLIQEQNSKGRDRALLVASPSMLSSVERDKKHSTEDGVICDLLLLNRELGGLHLLTLINSGSKDQFSAYALATAKAVKKSLVMNGGCCEKFYITSHVVPCDRVGTEPLYELSPDHRYPKEYDLQSPRAKIHRILQSLVRVLAQVPSFLASKQGLSFFNLLTKEQFKLLYEEIDEHKELWIEGVAGTGKTVIAVEFIKELIRRDVHLRPKNVLYVCENLGILSKIRKLGICECRTRQAFMNEEFPQIWHVILDEVQNFRSKEGDWLEKARGLVRQHTSVFERASNHESNSVSDNESDGEFSSESDTEQESSGVAGLHPDCNNSQDDGPGYLWIFLDRNQINHSFPTAIPTMPHPCRRLKKVIRNSIEIFNYAKRRLREEATRQLTIGHDFSGEKVSSVKYPEGKQIAYLILVLKSLLKEGFGKRDIAVLFGKQESIPGGITFELCKHFGLTTDAENNDADDKIVLSTFRKYSGLDRPVVIAVDIIASLTGYGWPKASIYCASTRAMVKLVLLTKEKKGQKRKSTST